MSNRNFLNLFFICISSIFVSSCSEKQVNNIDYSFEVAKDVIHSVQDYDQVAFTKDNNLDLGFYTGQVWIKLEISNTNKATSYIILCNDLINRNYRFYKFDSVHNTFNPVRIVDLEKHDHRSFRFAKPNFKIDLDSNEKGVFLITTSSDGRILQATPRLITIRQYQSIKQQYLLFDIIFYGSVLLLLLINLFYFRLVSSNIYYYYGAYILSGCLMYLFVEGRLYGIGFTNVLVDHLMFIAIRVWIVSSILFALKFLETKTTNPQYHKLVIVLLVITLGLTTLFQFMFPSFSISTLHQLENIIGFVWIILSLITIGIAYKKRKTQSIYFLISYVTFLVFVTLGLLDSHTTILPGDPFSYFKIGTILEFIGFTYFISLLIKQKLSLSENLKRELYENRNLLQEKEMVLASNTSLVSVLKLIENSFSNDSDWNDFQERFKTLNPTFLSSLQAKHPNITKSEIRLLTLIRIGYSQKEIADMLHIAPDSVKKTRSRVRKKLALDEKEELTTYLQQF